MCTVSIVASLERQQVALADQPKGMAGHVIPKQVAGCRRPEYVAFLLCKVRAEDAAEVVLMHNSD